MEQRVYDQGSCVAAADLSTKMGHFVKITGARTVGLCTVLGEDAYGVLVNKPKAGQAAAVRRLGVAPVVASAAIAAGAKVTVAANGQAVTCAVGQTPHGTAVDAAGQAGDIIGVDLFPGLVKLA